MSTDNRVFLDMDIRMDILKQLELQGCSKSLHTFIHHLNFPGSGEPVFSNESVMMSVKKVATDLFRSIVEALELVLDKLSKMITFNSTGRSFNYASDVLPEGLTLHAIHVSKLPLAGEIILDIVALLEEQAKLCGKLYGYLRTAVQDHIRLCKQSQAELDGITDTSELVKVRRILQTGITRSTESMVEELAAINIVSKYNEPVVYAKDDVATIIHTDDGANTTISLSPAWCGEVNIAHNTADMGLEGSSASEVVKRYRDVLTVGQDSLKDVHSRYTSIVANLKTSKDDIGYVSTTMEFSDLNSIINTLVQPMKLTSTLLKFLDVFPNECVWKDLENSQLIQAWAIEKKHAPL